VNGWIEVISGGAVSRHPLRPGLTRVGGAGSDVVLDPVQSGEIQFWDEPPRAVYIAGAPRSGAPSEPLVGETPLEEALLEHGDRIRWGEAVIVFGVESSSMAAVEESAILQPLEESAILIPGEDSALLQQIAVSEPQGESATSALLQAGILVDLGLSPRATVSRWQQAVKENRFDADACAAQVLRDTARPVDGVIEARASRLLRDFLMAPLQTPTRSSGRRAKRAAKGFVAFIIAQAVVFLVILAMVGILFLALRARGKDLNVYFDRVLPTAEDSSD